MPRLTGFARVALPGPAPSVIGPLGNVLRFFADPVGTMLRLHREFGNVASVARDNPALVFAFGAALNQEGLTRPASFLNDPELPVRIPQGSALQRLTRALPFANGDAHRRRRRLMMPAFARQAIDGYAGDIVAVTDALLDRWPKGAVVDVAELLRELTVAITLRCMFGLDALDPDEELGTLEATLLEVIGRPATIALPFDAPGLPFRRLLRTSERIEERLRRLIAERRAAPGGRDAFSLIVGARDEDRSMLSDAELVGEANGLFVAGYDTSAQTLSWTLLLLSQHPEVMGPLVEQLEAELRGAPPTPETIPRLTRLDAAIRESMRLLPATAMLFIRVLSAEATVGGVKLPKDANVVLSPLVTHRDPACFPEPDRFLPSRWETAAPGAYEYLPFGAGARMCIGAAFATLALRLMLARLLQRFRPALVDGARVDRAVRGVAMAPKAGLPMRLAAPPEIPKRVRWTGDVRELFEARA